MKRGSVLRYDPSKGYGFFDSEEEDDIWVLFRLKDNASFIDNQNDLQFLDSGHNTEEKQRLRVPRKNERVLFELDLNFNGFQAIRWGYYDDYQRIAGMTGDMKFRIRRLKLPQNYPVKPWEITDLYPETIWQGENIDELIEKFQYRPPNSDPLELYVSCGDQVICTWIEIKTYFRPWHRLMDPRPSIKKVLQKTS